jgi:hypothetical protein
VFDPADQANVAMHLVSAAVRKVVQGSVSFAVEGKPKVITGCRVDFSTALGCWVAAAFRAGDVGPAEARKNLQEAWEDVLTKDVNKHTRAPAPLPAMGAAPDSTLQVLCCICKHGPTTPPACR